MAAGESISFVPGITDTFGFFTDVFLSNRSKSTLSSDLKLFYTAIGAPPAVVNAIADALVPFGVEITRLPLTPSAIVELIEGAR